MVGINLRLCLLSLWPYCAYMYLIQSEGQTNSYLTFPFVTRRSGHSAQPCISGGHNNFVMRLHFFFLLLMQLNKTQPNFSRTIFFVNFWSTKICFDGQIFGNFLLFLVAVSDYDQTQPKRLALKVLVNTVTIFCSTSVKEINKYISTQYICSFR